MDELETAIENVKQKFWEMRKALINYDWVKQKSKKRLRSVITVEEHTEIIAKMKNWLNITQELIDRDILFTGFDEDCVFGHKFMRKSLPKLRIVGRDGPSKLESLFNNWEDLTEYLLSKGYLDKIPDVPGFELRDYIVGVKELINIVEKE